MKLSPDDAALFFKLMWSLQLYVNNKLEIFPEAITIEDYQELSQANKKHIRDTLYTDASLIDGFIKDNPQGLTQDEINIVSSWKQFLMGDFFIERLLKKYAVFIGDDKVYGVLALQDSFEDILANARLPIFIKAVLLPFRDKITYDGFLEGYNVYIGGGIASNLKETYMIAKQNGRILESLDPLTQIEKSQRKRKPTKDWRPDVDDLQSSVKKLRSSSGDPPILSPVFSFAKASIELTRTAVNNPDDIDELWREVKKVHRALKRVETTLYRTEY